MIVPKCTFTAAAIESRVLGSSISSTIAPASTNDCARARVFASMSGSMGKSPSRRHKAISHSLDRRVIAGAV